MEESKRFLLRTRALHRRFLAVLIIDTTVKEFRAFYVPVPGLNHEREARVRWRRYGEGMSSADAAHFFKHHMNRHRATDPDSTYIYTPRRTP